MGWLMSATWPIVMFLLAGRTQEGFGGIGPIIESLFLFVFGLSTLVYAVSQTSI